MITPASKCKWSDNSALTKIQYLNIFGKLFLSKEQKKNKYWKVTQITAVSLDFGRWGSIASWVAGDANLASPTPLRAGEHFFFFLFSSLLFYTLCVLESVIMMSQTMMTMAMMSKRRRTMRILMNNEDLRMESYKMRTLPIFECFFLSSYWIETLPEFDRNES